MMQEKKMTERGCERDPWHDQCSGEREQRQVIHTLASQKRKTIRWQGSRQTEDDVFPHNVAESCYSLPQKIGMFVWIALHCNLKSN